MRLLGGDGAEQGRQGKSWHVGKRAGTEPGRPVMLSGVPVQGEDEGQQYGMSERERERGMPELRGGRKECLVKVGGKLKEPGESWTHISEALESAQDFTWEEMTDCPMLVKGELTLDYSLE